MIYLMESMGWKRRYANKQTKSDTNSAEIVATFKKLGASVWQLDRPVDLIIGYCGRTVLCEIKQAKGKLTDSQEKFLDEWKGGMVPIARTVEDCAIILEAIRNGL